MNINKKIALIFIGGAVALLIFCTAAFLFSNSTNYFEVENQWICFSTYDLKGSCTLWKLNTASDKLDKLLDKRVVMAGGNLSSDGKWMAYADALRNQPWQGYMLDLNTKKAYQFTNNNNGKANYLFAGKSSKLVFGLEGGAGISAVKIYKYDLAIRKGEIFDKSNLDREYECFSLQGDNIIAVTYSQKEFRRMNETNGKKAGIKQKINYPILRIDTEGNILKTITNVKAESIESISVSKKDSYAILGAVGIASSGEEGYYRLDLENGKISELLTLEDIKGNNGVMALQKPYAAFMSTDDNKLYFNAVPKGSESMVFNGIEAYPSSLFCYNFATGKIRRITNVKDTFITSMSNTYY